MSGANLPSVSAFRGWLGLGLLTLASGACALTGYDFGDYERAAVNNNAAGDTSDARKASAAGAADTPGTFGVTLNAGGEPGSSTNPLGGAGGATETNGAAGAACEPQSCLALGVECGPSPEGDSCGAPLDCGGCFWWFQECRQNLCEISEQFQ